MIDTHCHLEQTDYCRDRDAVVERCKHQLQAVVTSCTHPKYFDITMQLIRKHKGFVFASVSVHPTYVTTLDDEEISEYFELIRSNKEDLVAIGETGLDYKWVKEVKWREKQKNLFVNLIALAKQLQLPLVIHSRDATEEVVDILQDRTKFVQMHMFTTYSLLKKVIDNGWFISVNTLLLKSKNVRKIVRDCPLDQLMLETDSPWLGIDVDGNLKPRDAVRNDPTAVSLVSEKIAQI